MTKRLESPALLRSAAENESASPKTRLDAATALLDQYGPTARNLRVLRRIIRQFAEYDGGESSQTNKLVRQRVSHLKGQLKAALAAAPIVVDPTDDDVTGPLVGNTHLLPPDQPDPDDWDRACSGATKRHQFFTSYGFPATMTRSKFIDALQPDPTKLVAHVTELKLWAHTRDELDRKFEQDSITVREALAEQGLEDSQAGLAELSQIAASGTPLFEFQPRSYDPDGSGLPQLARSAAGLLLDKIAFVTTWPQSRATHRPL
jgi:hypothetical protein